MTSSSTGFHEEISELRQETRDRHRAVVSLMEELEAVDWYDQRVDAARDPALREILAHNRDEEKEHACMLLEWLRRRDQVFDQELRTYLFSEGDIVQRENHEDDTPPNAGGALNIGSLRSNDDG